jgi:hypothetical protein
MAQYHLTILTLGILLTPAAAAQEKKPDAGQIITQPARDVGVEKTEIPPLLIKASEAPYSAAGLTTCARIDHAIDELSEVLGPDFGGARTPKNKNRAGKIAAAGGSAVVNSIIPFRGLVREISGAGPAERRLNAAIDAGFARRGFLHGLAVSKRCR